METSLGVKSMRVAHILKSHCAAFSDLLTGARTAEFRGDDRGYKVGDVVTLVEYNHEENFFTGKSLTVEITHVETGYGIPPGFCMLSFRVVFPEV
jgi:Domain of unknown function (DUF3850)